ncbi:hypothetical protein BHE74_00010966 [Ensete ventricosum]|nr:hypothetical protein BHE74_00010966 [Ensete ventricosum]
MGGTYRSVRLPVRGPLATGRFRQKSTIGGRLREKSIVGGRLREKREEEEEKKKKKEKSTYFPAPSSPVRRHCPQVASARASSPPTGHGHFFVRARRRNVSPCGEKVEATNMYCFSQQSGKLEHLMKVSDVGLCSLVGLHSC